MSVLTSALRYCLALLFFFLFSFCVGTSALEAIKTNVGGKK